MPHINLMKKQKKNVQGSHKNTKEKKKSLEKVSEEEKLL